MATTGGKTYPKRPTLAEGNALSTGFDGVALDGAQVATRRAGAFTQVGATIAADWPMATTRFYALDGVNGLDTNIGFSDVSLAVAGAVAVKTFAQLGAIVPKFGLGRKIVIVVAAGTYAETDDILNGMVGYQTVIHRGTITSATAGCTAFDNSAADKIMSGGVTPAGLNAPGYKATGAPTVSLFDTLTAGGAAPGYAAEPAIIGKRIRFDAATPTVLLRNVARMISTSTASAITVDSDLPAVPAVGGSPDIFYIEEPGVVVNDFLAGMYAGQQPAQASVAGLSGIAVVGIRSVSRFNFAGANGLLNTPFCEAGTTSAFVQTDQVRISGSWRDEAGASQASGTGLRGVGQVNMQDVRLGFFSSCSSTTGAFVLSKVQSYLIGQGCYAALGVSLQTGCGVLAPGTAASPASANRIGTAGSATAQPPRLLGVLSGAVLAIIESNCEVSSAVITGAGAVPAIKLTGVGARLTLVAATGSTGNTDVGLDLTAAVNATVFELTGNTVTGNAGDIRLAGPAITTHAGLTTTNVVDNAGNNVQGSAGHVVDACVLVLNQSGGALVVGDQVKSNGTTGQVTSAKADTTPESASLLGAMVTPPASTAAGYMVSAGTPVCNFDGAVTIGAIAYLSPGTAKDLTTTVPAAAGTNQRLRVGRVVAVTVGNQAKVTYHPESLAVAATGTP